ncbi:MAG: hypothetical protein C0491_05775 [Novosphingobium sp.]|nr:hypothetical protein [Novosphingobium sp.]
MKILTKKCAFCQRSQAWVLKPVLIEVNSSVEYKAALKAFAAEVQRFNILTRNAGGHDGQA